MPSKIRQWLLSIFGKFTRGKKVKSKPSASFKKTISFKERYEGLKSWLKSFCLESWPGKTSWKLFNMVGAFGGTILLMIILSIFTDSTVEESGRIRKENRSSNAADVNQSEENKESSQALYGQDCGSVKGLSCNSRRKTTSRDSKNKKSKKRPTIKYKATQVIVRKDGVLDKRLPTGSSFLGTLLTNIDTRAQNTFVRVRLPYGASFNGRKTLPKDTVLLGQAQYPGRGKRVFVTFNIAVLPSGREVSLQGTALDSKDFTPGLIGRYFSSFKNRAGASVGLAFLSGFSEVMQEREALGVSGEGIQGIPVINKKATLKNSVLSGLSEFSKTEGTIQLDSVKSKGPFVKVKSGKEIIISLTQNLNIKEVD